MLSPDTWRRARRRPEDEDGGETRWDSRARGRLLRACFERNPRASPPEELARHRIPSPGPTEGHGSPPLLSARVSVGREFAGSPDGSPTPGDGAPAEARGRGRRRDLVWTPSQREALRACFERNPHSGTPPGKSGPAIGIPEPRVQICFRTRSRQPRQHRCGNLALAGKRGPAGRQAKAIVTSGPRPPLLLRSLPAGSPRHRHPKSDRDGPPSPDSDGFRTEGQALQARVPGSCARGGLCDAFSAGVSSRRWLGPTPGRGDGASCAHVPCAPGRSHRAVSQEQGSPSLRPSQAAQAAGVPHPAPAGGDWEFSYAALATPEGALSHPQTPRGWPPSPSQWRGEEDPQHHSLPGPCSVGQPGPAGAEPQGQGVVAPPTSQGSPWWGWGQWPQVAGAAWEPQVGAAPPPGPAPPEEASAGREQMQAIRAPSPPLQEPGRWSALPSSLLAELLETPEFLQQAQPLLETGAPTELQDVGEPALLEPLLLSEEEYRALLEEL
nr:double homeobox protein 4-like protein 2 [Chlorocebus sabaeus]